MKKTERMGQSSMNAFWQWFLVVVFASATGSCVWHIHAFSHEYGTTFKIIDDKGFYEGKPPFVEIYGRFALSLLVAAIALVVRLSVMRDGLGTPARWAMIGFMPLTLVAGWTEMLVTASFHELLAASEGLLRYDEDTVIIIFFGVPLYFAAALIAWLFSFGAYSAGANLQNTDLSRNSILLYFYWFVIIGLAALSILSIATASSTADRYAAVSHMAVSLLWFYYVSTIGIGKTHKLSGKRAAELTRYFRLGVGDG